MDGSISYELQNKEGKSLMNNVYTIHLYTDFP